MKKIIKDIKTFNTTIGVNSYDKFEENAKDLLLSLDLIHEEFIELIEAVNNEDKVEALDACADLIVVIVGFMIRFKLEDKLEEALNLVYKSNMSKFCKTKEEALESIKNYTFKRIETYTKKVGKNWVIYRSSDDKVLKGINYKAPDLTVLFN